MAQELNAFYDLAISPASYDFCGFLQMAEMHRQRYGFSKLNIIIVPGPDRGFRPDKLKPYETKVMLLRNVVLPLCHLMPTCTSVNWLPDRIYGKGFLESDTGVFPRNYTLEHPIADYMEQGITAAYLRNESLTRFTAPQGHQDLVRNFIRSVAGDKKVLTLSLRQCSHHATKGREANIPEWKAFFDSLDPKEFQPVIISDTEKVFEPPQELAHYPFANVASIDVMFRTALYEQSYANFFTPNGPWACARFSQANTIMFKIIDNECHVTSDKWMTSVFGLNIGDQVAINPRRVRWSWENDDLEVIKKEFDILRNIIEDDAIANQKHGIHSVDHAIAHVNSTLSYTFSKMQHSVNIEDIMTLKAIEDLGLQIGGDIAGQLNCAYILSMNAGKSLPENILDLVRQVDQHYKTGLRLNAMATAVNN